MKWKRTQPNITVTRRSISTLGLISAPSTFGVVKSGFLVLNHAPVSGVLPRVPTVFKKDPDAINQFQVNQRKQNKHDYVSTLNINLSYFPSVRTVIGPTSTQPELLRNFIRNSTFVLWNRIGSSLFNSNLANQVSNNVHSNQESKWSFDFPRLTINRFAQSSQAHSTIVRALAGKSDIGHNSWSTNQSSTNYFLNRHGAWRSYRTLFDNVTNRLSQPLSVTRNVTNEGRFNQIFNSRFVTILHTNNRSLERDSVSSNNQRTSASLVTISLPLTLPKQQPTNEIDRRVNQFFSGPDITYAVTRQQSSENLVEALKDLQKVGLQRAQVPGPPPIPPIEQLTSQVRMQLERELRIERERRGL